MNAIKQAVGKNNAANTEDDVKLIQELLNHRVKQLGLPLLKVDGTVGPATIAAIEKFQQQAVGIQPDGVVSPGKRTWRVLAKGHLSLHTACHAQTGLPTPWAGVRIKDRSVNLKDVSPCVIQYLVAVAAFYNIPVCVTSGKRNLDEQAEVMWHKWENIRRNELRYIYLQNNPKMKADLDAQYQSKNFESFKVRIRQIGSQISRHLVGEAVDISLHSPLVIIQALESCMHHYPEKTNAGIVFCHHFDIRDGPKLLSSARLTWHA